MSKLTNRKFRTLMNRIFFGSLLSGILLFQGTGYITSNLFGATNENQTVSSTEGLTVSDSNVNVGLVGENGATTVATSGAIIVNNGATAAVGVLDVDESDLSITSGVELTLKENGTITVGSLEDSQMGNLVIAGAGIKDYSTVSTESSTNIVIGSGGLLNIGTDTAKGILNIAAGSQLLNNGNESTIDDETTRTNGINISANGELNIGSETSKTTGNVLDGDGRTINNGKITIYNESGAANQASFGVYSDASTASLIATGKLFVNGGAGTDGLITINGTLEAEEWESLNGVTFASTATVKIEKLVTLGSATDGANLTINGGSSTPEDAKINLGGIKIYSAIDPADDETIVGGTLTTDENSLVRINGLTEKMIFDGTLDATNGQYDIWLGNGFEFNGSVSMQNLDEEGDSKTIGIRFNGDSTIGSDATVTADKLILGGAAQTAGGTVTVTSSGEFIVTEELVLVNEDSTGKIKFVNRFTADEDKQSWIEKLTLSDNMIFANGVSTTSTTTDKAAIEIKTLTIDGTGLLETFSDSTMTVGTLAIETTNDQIALTTAGTSLITASDFQLTNGIVQLGSTGKGAGLNGLDADSILTIGVADQDETSNAQLTVLGTDATFSTGTINLEGQGQIVQEEGYSLTFNDIIVNNQTQISAESEKYSLSADEIIFGESAVYQGGQRVSTNSMTFQEESTLQLEKEETLSLTKDASLTLEEGATLAVGFGSGDDENGNIVLTGNGVASLVEGSEIRVSDISKLSSGEYNNRTVIETESLDNVFDSSLKKSAFYTLTKNENSTDQKLILDLNVQNEFAGLGLSANQKAVGEAIDSFRANDDLSDELRGLLDNMMEFETVEEVQTAMDALTGVGFANGMMLAMNSPWQIPFDQMNFSKHHLYPRIMGSGSTGGNGQNPIYLNNQYYRGQQPYADGSPVCNAEGGCYDDGYMTDGSYYQSGSSLLYQPGSLTPRNLWGSAYYTSFNAKSDGNSQKYGISRSGMSLGYDALNSMDAVLGINFNYSLPYLYTNNQRIEMNNFQLGLYGGRQFYNGVEIKAYVGLGIQQYQSKRTVEIENVLENYFKNKYNGQSVSASVQLSRSMSISPFALIRPLIQVDLEQVWQDGYSETSSLASALNYQDASWNRTFARAGFEGEFNTDFFQFTSRAIYGIQLGGDNAPTFEASFVGAPNSSAMSISGVDLGDSFVDFGIGALGYLDCERKWGISGNYDFVTSNKSTAHTGVVSLLYLF
ncbi:MAG: autotransporter outer membrane beta-barrel domain-containing protein [Planctomycetia bacterium]|nr:autotransporter outer membrane beta-barrel domain-containing protein [Planctomycetia bacterium]